MNHMIAWFAENRVAANLLMLLIVVAGAFSIPQTRKELIPDVSLGLITVSVAYPGASPEEVEQSICVRIEEAIFDLEGIRQLTSNARENVGLVQIEVEQGYDARELLDDVKSRVDGITSFPKDAEKPVVKEISIRNRVANIVISGQTDEFTLKRLAEQTRDDLTALPSVTQVELINVRPSEISIEVSESQLQRYGLTFDEVARAVQRSSLDLPGGTMKTAEGDVLLRTQGQSYWGREFERIILRAQPDGSRITLGHVADVIDGFEQSDEKGLFNGDPAIFLTVFRIGEQSILDISRDIRDYIEQAQPTLPEGMSLQMWQDRSVHFKGRTELLLRNAATGLLLVFGILLLFLRWRLAFWVSLGIPISFMGALWMLPHVGGSINMISMFAFILVLGIVVDDAIVVGENVHAQHRMGNHGLSGAILGAQEVAKPVIFAVLTTVVTFMPILFLPGSEGKLWMVIPMVVITTLLFSLVECLLILPAHLSGIKETKIKNPGFFSRIQLGFAEGLERFIRQVYRPTLAWALRWRYATVATFLAVFMIFTALVGAGWLRTAFFPMVDGDMAVASVSFAEGTPVHITEAAVDRIEQAAIALQQELLKETGGMEIGNRVSAIGRQPMSNSDKQGSYAGEVAIELAPSEFRSLPSSEIVRRWREKTGDIPGALELTFKANMRDSGPDINVELSGNDLQQLQAAADALKLRLREYPGVHDIQDSFQGGKQEVQLRLKPEARDLDISLSDLALQVRQAFHGEEVQRIQRGRDEVKVFVRYPEAERRSLFYLENMHIRVGDGREVPILAVADVEYGYGPAEVRRVDRRRVIQVSAVVDETKNSAEKVMADVREGFLADLSSQFPRVKWGLAGQQKNKQELIQAMINGFALALLGIYALMAIPFRSYTQPLMVMSAIPFGLIGAILGHFLLGLEVSLLSLTGMIAVAGVVVNDNLVLVDYINRKRNSDIPLAKAIREAGAARFRPILLTSLTTFAGLTPLMLEKSVQAQFLIPMAVSLAFGVMFATVVSLVLVPALYFILEDAKQWRLRFTATTETRG